MEPLFENPKQVSLYVTPDRNAYAIVDSNRLEWVTCRDRMAILLQPDTQGVFFVHGGEGQAIAQFVTKTEEIIGVNKFSRFAETNRPFVLWVYPEFWLDEHIKRSFFTLLLRLGRKYDIKKDNYEEALFSHAYTKTTKAAVMRFLFGHTQFIGRYKGTQTGWRDTFITKSSVDVRRVLVSPTKKEISCPLGAGSLWR